MRWIGVVIVLIGLGIGLWWMSGDGAAGGLAEGANPSLDRESKTAVPGPSILDGQPIETRAFDEHPKQSSKASSAALLSGRIVAETSGEAIDGGRLSVLVEGSQGGEEVEEVDVEVVREPGGRFRVLDPEGACDGHELIYLELAHPFGLGSRLASFPRGSEEVELRVALGGRVSGKVVSEDGKSLPPLEVVLFESGGTIAKKISVSRRGDFVFIAPACAEGQLVLIPDGADPRDPSAALARIEGLTVTVGEECGDSRLERIVLRGLPARQTLRFVDPEGKPLVGVAVTWIDGSRSRLLGRSNFTGQFRVRIFRAMDLRCGLRGFRTETLRGVTGSCEVRLRRVPKLVVRVRDLPFTAATPPELGLELALMPRSEQSGGFRMIVTGHYHPPDEFHFEPGESGDHEVYWMPRGKDGRYRRLEGCETLIQVERSGDRLRVEVPLPDAVREHMIKGRKGR